MAVGCGAGVISVIATAKGCSQVTATDISPAAAMANQARVVRRGVGPRDRVGIHLCDSPDNLIHYLAVTRLEGIAVLVNGEMDPAIAVEHFRRTDVAGIQTDAETSCWRTRSRSVP